MLAQAVFRGHDGLQGGRQAARAWGARPAEELAYGMALFATAIDNATIQRHYTP